MDSEIEPNWDYLKNFHSREVEMFKKYNIEWPKIYYLDEFGKHYVSKFKLIDLLKIYYNEDLKEHLQTERLK